MTVLMLSALCLPNTALAAEGSTWPYRNETQAEHDARMEWWRDARFGMFIHWGVYAVPAGTYEGKQIPHIGEWIMHDAKIPVARYKEYAKQFNPVNYDPDAWVRLAKEAGMKYIVITSKHHDGFALFDSKVTDWDIVDATPYGKDLLKPLAEACRRHGIKLGFYYSQAQDWNHPGGAAAGGHWDPAQDGSMDDYLQTIVAPQIKEILTNYGDIAVLWWDTPVDMTKDRADMIQPLLKLQPGIITNNRLGYYPGDTETPEQHIPATGFKDRDWETCMTMNGTWGFKSYDDNWKSTETLLQNLVDIASKGGNYLLNVGPTAEGEIPQPSIDRLREVGQWMKVNGESIYGTTASPFAALTWGRCTKKVARGKTTLYLHVFDWPTDGKLVVPGLMNKPSKTSLLASGKKLKAVSGEEGLTIAVPDGPLDEIDTVVAVVIKGDLDIQKVLPRQDEAGVVSLLPLATAIHNVFGAAVQVEEKDHKKNIGYWTSADVTVDWDFNIDRPGTFNLVADVAIASPQTQFQVKVGGQTVDVSVSSTGSYDVFGEQTLGQVTLDKSSDYKLALVPTKGQWQPLNIRSIRLVPAE
jgi:alpha-L-fucosidase